MFELKIVEKDGKPVRPFAVQIFFDEIPTTPPIQLPEYDSEWRSFSDSSTLSNVQALEKLVNLVTFANSGYETWKNNLLTAINADPK